ncbi:MAG: hypothetical protein QGD88_08360 [Anaerolineae bacterium]|nr:hypothetical protein [Anaerolineae bacterium]MDK1081477.1 hypothetical protein [Anaerolineae bacterium]
MKKQILIMLAVPLLSTACQLGRRTGRTYRNCTANRWPNPYTYSSQPNNRSRSWQRGSWF